MHKEKVTNLVLADDDLDDYELFQDALEELIVPVNITYCANGVELMDLLQSGDRLPDIIFLDLNMPQKTGLECLREIRADQGLQDIPVVIFSTSFDPDIVRQLHQDGADRYLVKPNHFKDLKKAIRQVLNLESQTALRSSTVQDFVLQP